MYAGHSGEGGHHQAQKSEPCRSYLGAISELNNAELVDTNTSAAACQQEADGISQHLEDDDPPRVGNFDTCVLCFDGVGQNFRDFLVA